MSRTRARSEPDGGRNTPGHPDLTIDRLARAQHGVASRRQLIAEGLTHRIIDRRIATGRLHPLWPGVYRVGPIDSPHGRKMAAVLACGTGAVLSHRTAGALLDVLPDAGPDAAVELTVPRAVRRRLDGVVAHRTCRAIGVGEVVRKDGLPVTSHVRTLLDLAGVLAMPELERAVARVERAGQLSSADLLDAALKWRSLRGAPPIIRLLADGTPAFTRSDAEALLLDLIRRFGLRRPRVNERLLGYEVDFLWPDDRLIVEVDGYAYHASHRSFVRDRRRDVALTAAGYRVLRVTWDDLASHPEKTILAIARALGQC